MNRVYAIAALVLCASVRAAQLNLSTETVTPLNADGTLKSATSPGASLVIDDWKCTIQSQRGIRCDNTSDYCVKLFERVRTYRKHMFGCGVEGYPNYPCDEKAIDPLRDGADKSDAGRSRIFRYNYEICGPHGVGTYIIEDSNEKSPSNSTP